MVVRGFNVLWLGTWGVYSELLRRAVRDVCEGRATWGIAAHTLDQSHCGSDALDQSQGSDV